MKVCGLSETCPAYCQYMCLRGDNLFCVSKGGTCEYIEQYQPNPPAKRKAAEARAHRTTRKSQNA
jgi:hypothetical protein